MTRTALIGSTGFVGGNLARSASFDDGYHSSDIQTIAGKHYELIVCAGMPAEKWRANQEPELDRASLDLLVGALESVSVGRFVLISTVDVYPEPSGVDESTTIDESRCHAYGLHRLLLERWVSSRFAATILRLPGLFGPGLKKNIVFDLLNGRSTEGVPGESRHQYYDLTRIWGDVQLALDHGLSLVNLATEPVSVESIASHAFGLDYPRAATGARVARYDMRTLHAPAFGGSGAYIETGSQVLDKLRDFVESRGWRRP